MLRSSADCDQTTWSLSEQHVVPKLRIRDNHRLSRDKLYFEAYCEEELHMDSISIVIRWMISSISSIEGALNECEITVKFLTDARFACVPFIERVTYKVELGTLLILHRLTTFLSYLRREISRVHLFLDGLAPVVY